MRKSRWLSLTLATAALAVLAATATASAARAPYAAAAATAASCKSPTIGFAAPITGPAASLGVQQKNWFRFFVGQWNAKHSTKLKYVEGDTKLPDVAEATKVAQQFASNSSILAVVGPAGSQENQASTAAFKRAGLAWVSGSATADSLTDGSRAGYMFRTVPRNAAQAGTISRYMLGTFGVKSGDTVVIVDDKEAYGQGLSDAVQKLLTAAGVKVQRESIDPDPAKNPDFASLAAKVPNNAKAVYIPWQLPTSAQTFGQALKEQGRNVTLFGSDGLFDPTTFKINGSYVSLWARVADKKQLAAFQKKYGGPQYFGAPSYLAAQVVAEAIARACTDGKVSRAEIRAQLKKTNIATSLSGSPVRFNRNGDLTIQQAFIFKIVGGSYIAVRS
jgi:branched-chain amino acid transport system substrate-binding protein